MAGALMQLVAYGAQDVYLTSEPTITFWKAVYRRHTNFAIESIEQSLTGNVNFGNRVICRISRNGDLMGPTYVEATITANGANIVSGYLCNRFGFALLKTVELRIGGQMIDRIYSYWMHIWTELTYSQEKKMLLDRLVGETRSNDTSDVNDVSFQPAIQNGSKRTFLIPLLFSYCRHPGLAIPLIALQYHEVEIQIDIEELANINRVGVFVGTANNGAGAGAATEANIRGVAATVPRLSKLSLWVDYVFLDTDERKEFAQKPHEYLVEVLQEQRTTLRTNINNSVRLTFNHPTKFLAWIVHIANTADRANGVGGRPTQISNDIFTNFIDIVQDTVNGSDFVSDANLKLNGQDRFALRDFRYFNMQQPYQHFSGKPDTGINVYSFAVKPEEHQPSGTCNFSRIDNTSLELVTSANTSINKEVIVYGLSYNVFRVASGMGGLAYSN